MTDILPPAGWPSVRQLETNEFAAGGANGNMNEQAKSLAARSELLKQYAALPYESKTGGYALNERVQLATGDIVRSTIASNVNNPNVDMTGWMFDDNTVESIADLIAIQNPKDGHVVSVSGFNKPIFGTTYPFVGGGEFRFSALSNKVADGCIIIDVAGGKWVKQKDSLTVDDFGALGDGQTGDATAFQKYIDSPYTSNILHLADRKAVYLIEKEVDFKGKGFVGAGYGVHDAQSYECSVLVPSDFVGETAFRNVAGTLRNVNMKQEFATATVHGIHVKPYLLTASNINIDGFGYQVWGTKETCITRFSDFSSLNAKLATVYFPDTGIDHTTTYFERIHFQWGNYSAIFGGNCYGFSFKDITIEWMAAGLKSKLFTNCVFDTFWCEGRQGANGTAVIDVIEQVTAQQLNANVYSNFRFVGGWTSNHVATNLSQNFASGGVSIHESTLIVANSTGSRAVLSNQGLSTAYANWMSANRKLLITTQDTADESGYRTPIEISAPNDMLNFTNQSASDFTPVVFKRLVGSKAGNPVLARETLSQTGFRAQAYDAGTDTFGYFQAPVFVTWDSTSGWDMPVNGGWKLTKINTGKYRLSLVDGSTTQAINGHVVVSGVFSTLFLLSRVEPLDVYAGSWSAYRAAAGYDIYFSDIAGAAKDPSRFTVAFTMAN